MIIHGQKITATDFTKGMICGAYITSISFVFIKLAIVIGKAVLGCA